MRNKKLLLVILLFVSFILFRKSIWRYYDDHVVNNILSKIESSWLTDVTLFLIMGFLLIATFQYTLNKIRVRNEVFYGSLFFYVLFIYCRFFSSKYPILNFRPI
jgi:hypothetical protein